MCVCVCERVPWPEPAESDNRSEPERDPDAHRDPVTHLRQLPAEEAFPPFAAPPGPPAPRPPLPLASARLPPRPPPLPPPPLCRLLRAPPQGSAGNVSEAAGIAGRGPRRVHGTERSPSSRPLLKPPPTPPCAGEAANAAEAYRLLRRRGGDRARRVPHSRHRPRSAEPGSGRRRLPPVSGFSTRRVKVTPSRRGEEEARGGRGGGEGAAGGHVPAAGLPPGNDSRWQRAGGGGWRRGGPGPSRFAPSLFSRPLASPPPLPSGVRGFAFLPALHPARLRPLVGRNSA